MTYLSRFAASIRRKEDKAERLAYRLQKLEARGRNPIRLRQRIRRLVGDVAIDRQALETWDEYRWG